MGTLQEIAQNKKQIINEIIKEEYEMFSSVKNIGGRASCQDDYKTFYVMRFSQHGLFGMRMLESYKSDLSRAKNAGRNLIAEKYSRMMEGTEPDYFKTALRAQLPKTGIRTEQMTEAITTVFMSCYEVIRQVYPNLLQTGRTPFGDTGGVSIHRYFSSELKTWSEETLQAACEDLIGLLSEGRNPVEMIYDFTVQFYGFNSLDDAEKAQKEALEIIMRS